MSRVSFPVTCKECVFHCIDCDDGVSLYCKFRDQDVFDSYDNVCGAFIPDNYRIYNSFTMTENKKYCTIETGDVFAKRKIMTKDQILQRYYQNIVDL